MYENLSGVQHRSAIVDVTDRCNLRCKHCFYFREEHESKVVVTIMLFAPLKEYQKLRAYKHTEVQETALDFSWEERDRFLDRLIALRKKYPNFIINPDTVLEMMKSENAHEAISRCNMPRRTLTLDLKLNRKLPCVLGAEVDCSKCGCAFPYEQEARRRGLKNKVMFSE